MEVRKAKPEAAQQLLKLFMRLDTETDFMLFEPEERSTTVEEQKSILSMFENDESKVMFIAESYEVCGFCVLVGGQQNRTSHVASLVIGVLKSHWGKGVGSALIENAILSAKEKGIARVELTVNVNN